MVADDSGDAVPVVVDEPSYRERSVDSHRDVSMHGPKTYVLPHQKSRKLGSKKKHDSHEKSPSIEVRQYEYIATRNCNWEEFD